MSKATEKQTPKANDIFSTENFKKSVTQNEESAKLLKNKRIVRVAKRTHANSILRRNSALTESASVDLTIACLSAKVSKLDKKIEGAIDLSGKVTVQQAVEFCSSEFILINRSRFVDHLKKNAYQKEHVVILDNDILSFV